MVGGEEASMERWVDLFWGFEVVAKLPTKKLGEKKKRSRNGGDSVSPVCIGCVEVKEARKEEDHGGRRWPASASLPVQEPVLNSISNMDLNISNLNQPSKDGGGWLDQTDI